MDGVEGFTLVMNIFEYHSIMCEVKKDGVWQITERPVPIWENSFQNGRLIGYVVTIACMVDERSHLVKSMEQIRRIPRT